MLVKLSGLVSEVAGSMGGMTLQRSPDGTIGRSKPLPIRRRSTYSSDARQRLHSLLYTWRSLSPTQRADWQTFSNTLSWYNRFGDPVPGTGYRAFLRNNLASWSSPAGSYTATPNLVPPTDLVSVMPASPQVLCSLSNNIIRLVSPLASVDADTRLFLFASAPRPAGRQRCYTPMPFLTMLPPGTLLPTNLTSAYQALHGRLPSTALLESVTFRVQARSRKGNWPGIETELLMAYV